MSYPPEKQGGFDQGVSQDQAAGPPPPAYFSEEDAAKARHAHENKHQQPVVLGPPAEYTGYSMPTPIITGQSDPGQAGSYQAPGPGFGGPQSFYGPTQPGFASPLSPGPPAVPPPSPYSPVAGPSGPTTRQFGPPIEGERPHEHKKGLFGSIKEHFAHAAEKRALKKFEKHQEYVQECMYEENQRWGTGRRLEIVRRYQAVIGISHYATEYHKDYLSFLRKGYFEPIPLAWSTSNYNPLTAPVPFSNFEDGAEERLYWVLNHSYQHGKPRLEKMCPSDAAEMAMAYKRMRQAQDIDTSFASDGDLFRANPKHLKLGYTPQVNKPPTSMEFVEMQHQAHEGTIEVDTMILLDVSSSMGWDHKGFDQPRHVDVVHNILRRAIYHMGARDHYPDVKGHRGVETVLFNSTGFQLGKIGPDNFERQWGRIRDRVYSGGGTEVMKGWQLIKNLHFNLHGGNGKAWYDEVYGWQATPEMPKLSLLVMLGGEATDMDEFELELLGETWCYVTILLIGQENCPHHHRHANELDRISHANEHVQYYDCHGRLCERLVVYDVLERVYAENAPTRQDIMNPAYDIPPPSHS